MKKSIVITSIFQPTEAVTSFAGLDGFQVIVIGDKKTSYHIITIAERCLAI